MELPHGAGQAGCGQRPPKPHCPRALQTEYARYENGHYSYRIHRSPLCEYMINFIHKLKHLPEKYMMNSVLENFTILQVCARRGVCAGVGGESGRWAEEMACCLLGPDPLLPSPLQVVTNRDTQETLLCVAYVFEVSASEHGAQHHIYRLVKE